MTAPLPPNSPLVDLDDMRVERGRLVKGVGAGLPTRPFFRWLYEFWEGFGFGEREVWNDLPLRQQAIGTVAIISGSIWGVSCPDGSTTEVLRVTANLPNNYVEGTDLLPYIRWAPANTDTGICRWRLNLWVGGDGDVVTEQVETHSDDAAGGTANIRQTKQGTAFDGAAFKKGDTLIFNLQRIGGSASDTFAGTAYMLDFGIKYRIEGAGTTAPFPEA